MKKKPAKRKKVRRAPSVALVRRHRKDLELKDYLTEEHPELGVPPETQQLGRTLRTSRAEKDRD